MNNASLKRVYGLLEENARHLKSLELANRFIRKLKDELETLRAWKKEVEGSSLEG